MKKIILKVTAEVGLHARPAARFVQQASKFSSKIVLRNLTAGSNWAEAKSILSVMALGVEKDHQIELEVDGADETEAAAALSTLVNSNFGEVNPAA